MTYTPPPGIVMVPTAELEDLRARAAAAGSHHDLTDDELIRQIRTAAAAGHPVEEAPASRPPERDLTDAEATFIRQVCGGD